MQEIDKCFIGSAKGEENIKEVVQTVRLPQRKLKIKPYLYYIP